MDTTREKASLSGSIYCIDRASRTVFEEKVFGIFWLKIIYKKGLLPSLLRLLTSRSSFFSSIYGILKKFKFSKNSIAKFIKNFDIDPTEFVEDVDEFSSFNDFFIRKLKKRCRPIDSSRDVLIAPADGRYLCFGDFQEIENFSIKEEKFSSQEFLKDYYDDNWGPFVLIRLAPVDCHRFCFPCNCFAKNSRLINGYLYSVNPMALWQNFKILSSNKRTICELVGDNFGKMLMVEIGATNVGSICQTYEPNKRYDKGEEKGYFSLGGSSIVLVFEKGKIVFDEDLVVNSKNRIETRCLYGQSLGKFLALQEC